MKPWTLALIATLIGANAWMPTATRADEADGQVVEPINPGKVEKPPQPLLPQILQPPPTRSSDILDTTGSGDLPLPALPLPPR